MCGLGFFINYDKSKKLDLEMVRDTFLALELRGTDASGYYFEREENGKIIRLLIKSGIKAGELWEKTQEKVKFNSKEEEAHFKKYRLNGKERLIMIHTRSQTLGSRNYNGNNHPIFSDRSKGCEGYVLVHNGMVYGANVPDYPYQGRVDSEEILANIEKYGIVEGLSNVSGGMAIIFKRIKEDKIYLYRNSNPMDLLYLPDQKILIGASDESYVDIPNGYCSLKTKIFTPKYHMETLPSSELYSLSLIEKDFKFLGDIKEKKARSVLYRQFNRDTRCWKNIYKY